jgi:uncharacterized protein YcsI (UPF0317 family)
VQANLVVVPAPFAADFRRFCQLNPRPCPLLEVSRPGETGLRSLGHDVDLRRDLPRYRVFRRGEVVEEPPDVVAWWRGDLVAFLLGCSFSFEEAMLEAGLPVRHVEEGRNVPMYRTNLACQKSGPFEAQVVVSMRPLRPALIERATEICERFPFAHGAPLRVGDPETFGVKDLGSPDYGEAVTVHEDEVPLFWACGVTSQEALQSARVELAITHSPGCMFVSDLTALDLIGEWRQPG